MKKIIIAIITFSIAGAQEVEVNQYIENNNKYVEFKKNNKISKIQNKKKKENKTKLEKKIIKENKTSEENLVRIIEQDNEKEFKKYLLQKNAVEVLNMKLESKSVFKYPLHQAMINRSYSIMLEMVLNKDIKIDLIEESGTTTMDILKMYDYENYKLGREFIKEYSKRIKGKRYVK